MSAPTPAPGDDRPREGYYPDPSIPGYVRYWNGAAWVPGTSRPAPSDGEPLPAPPGAGAGAGASVAPPVEETGPHFFDEEPAAGAAPDQHGARPEPASAWQADAGRQAGLGAEQERRISWGAPGQADPRVPSEGAGASERAAAPESPKDESGPGTPGGPVPSAGEGTVTFRRPKGPVSPAGAPGASTPTPSPGADGTMAFRAVRPASGRTAAPQPSVPPQGSAPGQSAHGQASTHGQASGSGQAVPASGRGSVPGQASASGQASAPAQASAPPAQTSVPPQATAPAQAPAPAQTPAPQQAHQAQHPQQAHQTSQPHQPQPSAAPLTSGPGGGSPSWAQQVHQLAGAAPGQGEGQPVVPWKPVTEDPFLAAARAQASARPAGLGRRFVARLIDTVSLVAVTGAAALPLGAEAADHVDSKIDAAKLSGEKTTVWLLDATTAGYLGIVLAVLLLFGVVYEALPTAKWGRTLGKKVCGIEVRDIEEHETPTFGAALRRWLVYSVPGLLVVGVVGVLWCLFDRPWRQCWHDKAAGTFVAG
ncbi:hypothetical protein DMA15_13735 [Streptomyces sp. WAC 01529]|uniref:RDD family protein n=1 Tax=Streptomyces sp. WAC 01529 TaxID=2203205 RepID=UPI000F6E02DF|nr:RDD family protein [Streptomyces sp. WAC 01529]AZM53509.1 hypothetical protein DMA15_13735 [Streptomyces sp. WAC 01529]